MSHFIDQWPAKTHPLLVEALDWLASHDTNPDSDGVVGRWVTSLCAFDFQREDAPKIAALLGKTDPHLVEHGVKLATALLGCVDAWDVFEAPLVKMIARGPVDLWVAEAVVGLLSRAHAAAPPSVYRALARQHGIPAAREGIMRNRGIRPWRDLEEVYAQNMLQTLEPTERELAVLPILEKKLGTKGFLDTQAKVIRDLGYDPAEHRKLLARA